MSEETNLQTTVKIEPLDYPQVKQEFDYCPEVEQEFDDCDNICPEKDEIYLQRFLKSEVAIEEKIKQETIDEQDAVTKRTNLDEKAYLCDKKEVSEKQVYKCEICNIIFSTKQMLSQHEMIHAEERLFKCEICNKAFTRKYTLNLHERIHTGEGLFNCKICNKAFPRKHSLNLHERVHTGERPHEYESTAVTFSDTATTSRKLQIDDSAYNVTRTDLLQESNETSLLSSQQH
ncbi:zinc finger protein 626-like [Ctenocephalides felis]|uniref:zinc finger protein 626-like n=1 Tax=Ctenocephalides felis TaxID=7515 RepID=UPI000E6E3C7D|nr:zinc finger protein 626-like [Ctenocephalides felis]